MSLVEPCVEMLERGLRVDEVLRKGRLKALQERSETLRQELNELVLPLLEEAKEAGVDLRLFEQVEGVCPCCRHASKKQEACWSCAGFDSSPSKADLVARGGDPSKLKRELEEEFLGVCKVCGGVPRREWLEFNPNSGPQTQTILYDFLKLPKRMKDGRLTTDESALKSLVAFVA